MQALSMKCKPAVLGAAFALALTLAPAAQASASLNKNHGASAYTRHCCWDAPFNSQSAAGTDDYSVSSWSAQANISGSVGYGLIQATATAASDITSFVYANAVGEARDYWVETFHIQSATLATGTPVVLSLGVWMDASVNTSTVGQGYALAVIGTGLDAGWLTAIDTRNVGSGVHTASISFATGVGGSVTLIGQMNTRAWAELSNGPIKTATASSSATARFTVDSLTDGAFYSTTSGNSYLTPAPVPEADTTAMMLAGLGLLGVAARRKRQKLGA